MRKIIIFNMVTLDGFFEGPGQDIDWHNVDEEFNEFAIDQLKTVDAILFGRVTYQLMASYWPTPIALADDPVVAEMMNLFPKIVFSKTLDKADWENTRLVRGDFVEEIRALKRLPGKDLLIFGSANLATSFLERGLIDEIRVMVNPVILGDGTPLIQDIHEIINLKHLQTRTFRNGNVLLCYQPVEKQGERE